MSVDSSSFAKGSDIVPANDFSNDTKTTSISGLILNSLSLVLALTEQSANMPEFTSVIESAIEVLSKILKSFNVCSDPCYAVVLIYWLSGGEEHH